MMTTDEARIAPAVYSLSRKPIRVLQRIDNNADTVQMGSDIRSAEH